MIKHDGKTIVARSHGGADLCKKYHGDKLVWVKNIERRLPMEYQEVEYIESNLHQYLDTKINLTNKTSINVEFAWTTGYATVSGWTGMSNGATFGKEGVSGSVNRLYWYVDKSNKFTVSIKNKIWEVGASDTNKHKLSLDLSKDIATFDNTSYTYTDTTWYDDVPTHSLILFAQWFGRNNAIGNFSNERIYSCIIYENNICVGNFVPCYRKSDHKSGMYDTITNTFFTSETSTDFSVGANVKCKKLEYCENSNGNYIDLRMKLKSSYKTKVDFQVPQTTTENRGVIFGTRGTNTDTLEYSLDKAYVLVNWTKINNTPVTVDVWKVYQGDGAKRRYSISEANRYKRLLVEFSDTAIKVDGATVKTNTALTEFETVKSACIFGSPLVCLSGTQLLTEYVNAKIYSVEIKDKTDNLLFSLIPYQIGDTVGMLDTLSKVFFSGELVDKPFGTKQSRSR
ncbi:MAG: hypothetical protein MJ176_03335 [Treponema sp.]|nr:hypothetical protein [Treponema sp.]